jgi:hypothetical protein
MVTVEAALEAIVSPNPPRVPGEGQCRWCAAGGNAHRTGAPMCKAYADYSLAALGLWAEGNMPEDHLAISNAALDLSARDTESLSPDHLVGILDAREVISGFLRAVEAYAKEQLENGTAAPLLAERYKLVRGRSNRKWMFAEEETEKALKKIKVEDPETGKTRGLKKTEIYKEVLLGPAPIETLLKSYNLTGTRLKVFERLVEKPPGAVQIAPVDDPRERVDAAGRPDATDIFSDIAAAQHAGVPATNPGE